MVLGGPANQCPGIGSSRACSRRGKPTGGLDTNTYICLKHAVTTSHLAARLQARQGPGTHSLREGGRERGEREEEGTCSLRALASVDSVSWARARAGPAPVCTANKTESTMPRMADRVEMLDVVAVLEAVTTVAAQLTAGCQQ